jgi:mediator of RNA polymerase II transcription subunit 12, fungi type
MANCNLAQAAFVARLGDEYLDGMLSSRALTKPFADACLGKLVEVSSETRSDGVSAIT